MTHDTYDTYDTPQQIEGRLRTLAEQAIQEHIRRLRQYGEDDPFTLAQKQKVLELIGRLSTRRRLTQLAPEPESPPLSPNRWRYPTTITVQSSRRGHASHNVYLARPDELGSACDCEGFEYRGHCRHLEEAMILAIIKREDGIDGW